jgi:hypothetical protein
MEKNVEIDLQLQTKQYLVDLFFGQSQLTSILKK